MKLKCGWCEEEFEEEKNPNSPESKDGEPSPTPLCSTCFNMVKGLKDYKGEKE